MVAYTFFFATAAYTLNWRLSLSSAGIVWFVLFVIFRPGVCQFLSDQGIGTCLVNIFFGLRWPIAIVCAIVIWFRTSSSGWDGWWQLVVVVLIDLLATFVIDAHEQALVQGEIERSRVASSF